MSSLPAAVLWDLDGTLIDTEPYWMECELELVAEYGGTWTVDDAKSIVGFDLMDAAEVLRKRAGIPLRPAEIIERLMDGVVKRMRERMPWRPGARELLAALQLRRVPCALVTMSWKPITDVLLPQLPPGSFQTVITGENVMNGKPHPEPYRRAAEDLGFDPESCVAIEDSPTGVASAEAAGCVVVAVEYLVPIPTARHRVKLSTLQGVTPELLGEFVENTPPPERAAAAPPPAVPSVARSRQAPGRERPRRGVDLAALARGRWRLVGGLAAVLLLLVAGGVWWFAIRDVEVRYEPGPFRVHAWAPGWELDDSLQELLPRANLLHEVSPFWYGVTGLSTIQVIENTDEAQTEQFLGEARDRGIPVVATLTDQTSRGVIAGILADAAARTAHVDAIVAFAAENDFDGVDINYENFAFEDGRDSWTTTRPNWVAFIAELGTRLHADGRQLNVSVPPVYDDGQTEESGYWVYDYGGIAPHVDAIRIMAYDFSLETPGPIAPLEYGDERSVNDAIEGGIEAAGGPEKLVLGIPLYGRNWVIATEGECPEDAPGRQNRQLAEIPELIELREATPVYNEEWGEWTFTYQLDIPEDNPQCTQTREVHYLDAEGVKLRMQRSIDAGMLGVSLFAFGYEDDAVWSSIEEINATLPTTPPDETLPATTVAATTAATTATTVAATQVPPTTEPTTVPTTVATTALTTTTTG